MERFSSFIALYLFSQVAGGRSFPSFIVQIQQAITYPRETGELGPLQQKLSRNVGGGALEVSFLFEPGNLTSPACTERGAMEWMMKDMGLCVCELHRHVGGEGSTCPSWISLPEGGDGAPLLPAWLPLPK